MKKISTIFTLIALLTLSTLGYAHEGAHAAGQIHAAEGHIGLLEITLGMAAITLVLFFQLKKNKSKK